MERRDTAGEVLKKRAGSLFPARGSERASRFWTAAACIAAGSSDQEAGTGALSCKGEFQCMSSPLLSCFEFCTLSEPFPLGWFFQQSEFAWLMVSLLCCF